MKEYFNNFLTILARWLASMTIAALPTLLDAPIRAFVDIDTNILAFLLSFPTAIICLFIFSFKAGNKQKSIENKKFLISLLFLFVFLVLFALLIGSGTWIGGPTNLLAKMVYDMHHPGEWKTDWSLQYKYCLVGTAIAYVTVYAPTMLLGKYFGERKHRKEYGKLRDGEK